MGNPFPERKNKIRVTTTVHPDFMDALKESGVGLAEWIESRYTIEHENATETDLRRRVKFFAEKTVELQKELTALSFRIEMIERDGGGYNMSGDKKVPPPPPKRRGGVLKDGSIA